MRAGPWLWACLTASLVGCGGNRAASAPLPVATWGQVEPSPRLQAHESAALDAINTRLRQRGFQPAGLEARLARTAAILNTWRTASQQRDACDVGAAMELAALEHAGAYERPPCGRCFWSRRTPPTVPADVWQGMAECLAGPGVPLVGFNTMQADGRLFVAMVGARRRVVLDPLPRVVAPGTTPVLSGMAPVDQQPWRVLAAPADRPALMLPLTLDANGAFKLNLPPPAAGQTLVASVVDVSGQTVTTVTLLAPHAGASTFPRPASGPLEALAELQRLKAGLQAIRTSRGLGLMEEHSVLAEAAQQDASSAQPASTWAALPLAQGTLQAATGAVTAVWADKRVANSAAEVLWLMERDAAAVWALTRPVPTAMGVGLAQVGQLTAVLVLLGSPQPGAFSLAEAPAAP